MSQIQQQLLLDAYRRYYDRGIQAHKRGEAATARSNLLKASESLYKLASSSPPQLKQVRSKRAAELLAIAQAIDAKAGPSTGGGRAGGAPGPQAAADGAEPQSGESFLISKVPDVGLADVAGLEDVKSVLRKRVIYPFQHPEISRKYRKQAGGGVLLYGPPGTGKTMIAKAVANEVDAAFFSVKCSDIISKWVGEAERNLKKLFAAARGHARAVIFMDEAEAIVARRGGDSTVMNRVIPEFLAQVDGLEGRQEGLLLLGATNRPWDMDEAALRTGRFGELIYVPLPDAAARRAIIAAALAGIPMAAEVDVGALAMDTDGLSGADLVGLCEQTKDRPFEREIATGVAQRLEVADFAEARAGFRPSVTPAMLARYERFRHGAGTGP